MFGKLKEKIQKVFIQSFVSNIIRHALTAFGTFLIAKGLPQDLVLSWVDATIAIAVQALPILIALAWSLLEKKSLKRILAL